MQWNSETDKNDIVSDCKYWAGIDASDTTSFPLDDMSRVANKALDKVHMVILQADGNWRYDDNNNAASTLITTTSVIAGATKVAIPLTWLTIARVRITDENGNYVTLRPAKRRNWSDGKLNSSAGTPSEYALLGNWAHFDCPMAHAATVEVEYQTGPSYFDGDTDTTKTPGFVATFHQIIPLEMALEYCEINDLDSRAAKIRIRLGFAPGDGNAGVGLYKQLHDHYASRNQDGNTRLGIHKEDYGEANALL